MPATSIMHVAVTAIPHQGNCCIGIDAEALPSLTLTVSFEDIFKELFFFHTEKKKCKERV